MDSLKSIVVVAILLGVLYGIYQVINEDDSPVSPLATNLLVEFDKNDSDSQPKPLGANTQEKEDGKGKGNNGAENRQPAGQGLASTAEPPPSKFDPSSPEFTYPKKGSGNGENNFEPDNNGGFQSGNPGLQADRTL